jgi:hypothetical protein
MRQPARSDLMAVLERVLDKGVVIDASVRISLGSETSSSISNWDDALSKFWRNFSLRKFILPLTNQMTCSDAAIATSEVSSSRCSPRSKA